MRPIGDRNLSQDTVEAAFNVKWDLLLVQDRLAEAVQVCNTLLKLFPSSAIADQATKLLHGMGDIHPSELKVLLLEQRMVAEEPKTLQELGEVYGVSRERIRR